MYDDFPGKTMKQKGCAVTALTMGLDITGTTLNVFLNPGNLNGFMTLNEDFNAQHNVDWNGAVEDMSTDRTYNPSLKDLAWNGLHISTPAALAAALDASAESIVVGVPAIANCALTGAPKGHFVLVTGKTLNSDGTYTFSINDPGCAANKTLDFYLSFSVRGYVTDPPDRSAVTISTSSAADLTVVNPAGDKTGFYAAGSPDSFAIPNSYYYRGTITDADTGDDPTDITHYLGIRTPESGNYLVVVSGLEKGSFSITVKGYSSDGGRMQPLTVTYKLSYNSLPGSPPALSSIPGDINGDGVVNCSDLAIVKASFGKKVGVPGFDGRADVNLDGVVDIRDLAFVAQHLPAGTHCQ